METSKKCFKKRSEERRLEKYREKEMQSLIYKKQDKKCQIWLEQNLSPRKTAAIMSILEKMVETGCKEQRETVQHLLAGCKMLASSEYLARHNRALMVMAVAWAKEQNLLNQNVKWYHEK